MAASIGDFYYTTTTTTTALLRQATPAWRRVTREPTKSCEEEEDKKQIDGEHCVRRQRYRWLLAMSGIDLAEQKRLIEYAAKTAETFVSAYYAATDAPHRGQLIPGLYLPEATIVWNGHPISGAANLAALLNSMPGTKHEVQGFDCQTLGGGTQQGTFRTPSLLLTVAGVVVHHTPGSLSAMPPTNAPTSTTAKGGGKRGAGSGNPADGSDGSIPIDALGRAFSQNFVLVPMRQDAGGIASSHTIDNHAIAGRYYVQADTMRFVG